MVPTIRHKGETMISSQHLANPYPKGTAAHSYFHLWKLSTRNAERARREAIEHAEAAKFYLEQLVERAFEGHSNVEIDAVATEVDHVA